MVYADHHFLRSLSRCGAVEMILSILYTRLLSIAETKVKSADLARLSEIFCLFVRNRANRRSQYRDQSEVSDPTTVDVYREYFALSLVIDWRVKTFEQLGRE